MAPLGLVAAVAVVLGPLLAHFAVVRPLVGFAVFALGGLLALVAAIGTLVRVARGRELRAGHVAALVVGAAFVVVALRGRGSPRINDFTTDPADPPAFVHAQRIPENAGRDLAYPREYAAIQEACCGDLAPLTLPVPPAQAFARARATADAMPAWTVQQADPAAGTIEAVATTPLFRFRDDIVIRVRPDGGGSRVDVRSKSRDGKGDIGANVARIHAYLTALQAAR